MSASSISLDQLRQVGNQLLGADGVLLDGLAREIALEPDPTLAGAFFVAHSARSASRSIFPLGTIPRLNRFTLCHRYEPWWMKPRAGTRLSDVPAETQFFLAELGPSGLWLLLVPLIDEPWRFSLRGRPDGTLELLAETGDPHLAGTGGLALFVATGADPFVLLERGARAVQRRLGSGALRADKPLPAFVDHFGWCTWDAFYTDVSAEKVTAGLEKFRAAGVAPRFIILDDGWQSVRQMPTGERRLTAFAPNEKFGADLSSLVASTKRDFGIETFLVWHAVVGYWGGVDGEALLGYGVVEQPRRFGEGILAHCPRHNEDWWGGLVGLVPEADIARFYGDYHRSLALQGVDGVKVDSQAVLEGLAARQGGRVRLNRAYREALESSVALHFEGRLINCMASAQETFYGSPGSTLTRTSIDFFPERPETHAEHLYTNAHVGLWFGQFMHPDWDMFQSAHVFGAFHAAGRAVSGGPVYVSDKPGEHDVELLRALVCEDGSVLRADGPGLPTLDTLCVDPTREAVPLKIWNRSGRVGIVAAFHALYAAGRAQPVAGQVRPSDVRGLAGERFACYALEAGRLDVLGPDEAVGFSLDEAEFELFWLAPIENGFAALGLERKLNGPGALLALDWRPDGSCSVGVRDGGVLLAYAERPPRCVTAGDAPASGASLAFSYDPVSRSGGSGLLKVELGSARAITVRW